MSTRSILIVVVVIVLAVIAYLALTPDRGGEVSETGSQGDAESTQGGTETTQ